MKRKITKSNFYSIKVSINQKILNFEKKIIHKNIDQKAIIYNYAKFQANIFKKQKKIYQFKKIYLNEKKYNCLNFFFKKVSIN